jgi:MoxR-like ATPase
VQYRKTFDPSRTQVFNEAPGLAKADRGDRSIYVYTDEIILAVNVALATGRPLLVRGPSGCGKSTLARNVARTLNYRYYEHVVSSRTQARDLLWQVDLLRRLQDAQAKQLAPDLSRYVMPGVLWWALDRRSAAAQLARTRIDENTPAETEAQSFETKAVVLLDEIDKADPDVPNNLLVPLGSLTFTVEDTGEQVRGREAPLVFLTTNDERDLPPAFLRRCVEVNIVSPSAEQLRAIGKAHFDGASELLLTEVANLLDVAASDRTANPPSTAEYLDTIRACVDLGVQPGSSLFDTLTRVTVWKHGRTRPNAPLS